VLSLAAPSADQPQPPEWTAPVIWTLVISAIAAVAAVAALHYAKKSRQAAERANEIALRGEERDTERHDVYWEGRWSQPGTYVLAKRGADEVHDVKATVFVDDEEQTQQAELVTDDGHELTFRFPATEGAFTDEVIDYHTNKDLVPRGLAAVQTYWHQVRWRVDWVTSRKTPRHQNEKQATTFNSFYEEFSQRIDELDD
jgi:hypothetical protein